MLRTATALAAVTAVAAAASPSLARSTHHHRALGSRDAHHRLSGRAATGVSGLLVTVDPTAQTAVLAVGGPAGRSVTLDLSAANVYLLSDHSKPTSGHLSDLKAGDRVLARLASDRKTAKRAASTEAPLRVSSLLDRGPAPVPPSDQGHLGGTVTGVSGLTVTVHTGDGDSGRSVTLDLTGASLYGGNPPASLDASKIAVGDRVSVLLAVSQDVAEADVHAGTPVPVAKLYDGGPAPTKPQPPTTPPPPENGTFGGIVKAVSGNLVTVVRGSGDEAQTATLDVSSATVFGSSPAASVDPSKIAVGDAVDALLTVTRDVEETDIKAGTPLPVAKFYDAGHPQSPQSPPPPPPPPANPPPPHPQLSGLVTGVSGNVVTITVGDGSSQHSVALDLTGASVYENNTAQTVSVVAVGDRLYARLAVSGDVAEADAGAGTPIPVQYAYDLGPVPSKPAA